MNSEREAIAHYWRTSISDIRPGAIALRGYPIESLIEKVSFPAVIWLMLRGELPTAAQSRLLEASLVASVDHGPHAPSIAIARMAASTGLPLNGAMASAVNSLDDSHGGAGEQAIELFNHVVSLAHELTWEEAAKIAVPAWTATHGKFVPGFGHRFHPVDPRVAPLMKMVDEQVTAGTVEGRHVAAGRAVALFMASGRPKPIPMNIDGITAIIVAELGFEPALARGLFCLARSVGILAHAWEQLSRGERNKGPIPRSFDVSYEGAPARSVPADGLATK